LPAIDISRFVLYGRIHNSGDSPKGLLSTLTAERLKALLHYDPETGEFRWRVQAGARRKIGEIGGAVDRWGYRVIGICGRLYRGHLLAWLFEKGEWPVGELNHINTIKADNRIANLRLATRTQNNGNRYKYRSNQSGFKSVYWHPWVWVGGGRGSRSTAAGYTWAFSLQARKLPEPTTTRR
jgi:HNH endonuclease